MLKIKLFLSLWAAVTVLMAGCSATRPERPSESVVISETDLSFEITVSSSKLVLRMPKASFKRSAPTVATGSTASSRYFVFEDKVRGIELSGWFESAERFPGVKEPAVGTFEGQPLPHKNVSFEKVGSWDVVFYEVPFRAAVMENVNAHLVKAGTWVELHLSSYPERPVAEQRALLVQTIQSIELQEKQ